MEQRQALKCCKITFCALPARAGVKERNCSCDPVVFMSQLGRSDLIPSPAVWLHVAAALPATQGYRFRSYQEQCTTFNIWYYFLVLWNVLLCGGFVNMESILPKKKKIEKNLADHEKRNWLSCCITFGERNCFTTWLGSARGYAYLASIIEHTSCSSNPFHYLNGLFKNRLCHNLRLHNTSRRPTSPFRQGN